MSCSLRKRAVSLCACRGQEKRPCSNRLAQTHKPLPSQNNTFTRLRPALEHKPMARERVLVQHGLGEHKQFVEAGTQVHRLCGHENPGSRRTTQHRRSSWSTRV